jgi:hypothetical protein
MKRTLNDITADYGKMLNYIDDNDGEVQDDLLEQMHYIEDEFSVKVDRILSVVTNLESRAKAEGERATRIMAHKKALLNEAARIKNWVLSNMDVLGIDIVEGENYVAKVAKRPPILEVEPSEFFSWVRDHNRDDLLRFKDPEPNKTAIKDALKGGEKIRGATMITDGKRLAIK